MKEIIFGAGCYWGAQKFFNLVHGVYSTKVGFANGNSDKTTYNEVCYNNTNHVEAVYVQYDETKISLPYLLELYYSIIDPYSLNKQGNDEGTQYRTGIYYKDPEDLLVIMTSIRSLQAKSRLRVQIEVEPLDHFIVAHDEHQLYLEKNIHGYCHINKKHFDEAKIAKDPSIYFKKKTKQELKETLTNVQYSVTQENKTETPFSNEYDENFKKGIYVDITTGEPLFMSYDKFNSGCGWPAFSKPIKSGVIDYIVDKTHGMIRTEVRTKFSNSHLGHVFEDGPKDAGGLRYCINSASLKFIPFDELVESGYSDYIQLFTK